VSLFDEGIASPALMIMILSDPIASVIGIIFGKFKLVGEKTLEGSITFFIITAIVLISFKFTSFQVILVALGATLIELFSKEVNIDDNLLIPLVSAGLLVIF
jgi:dolichol kinase